MSRPGARASLRFRSTSGRGEAVDLRTALHRGPAPDGGLYTPETLPALGSQELAKLREDPDRAAVRVGLRLFGGDLEPPALDRLLRAALDFPLPLVRLREDRWVLELFHGPTGAFKDVGARVLARLLAALDPEDGGLTVLVATSGDTGAAVGAAFHGVPGTRVVILYPDGRVSPFQERQFTAFGDNVHAVAVAGSFDDCQRLAREAFADPELSRRHRLTSANSLNVGRLLPQVLYYFQAWAQLPPELPPAVYSVPSGNLGNLTAGVLAARMGLPVARFVAACNANDVLPELLREGRVRARPSRRTLSSAMDVGDPSNLPRLLDLHDGDLERLRARIIGTTHDDDATRRAMAEAHDRFGYLLDPHGAVGWLGLEEALRGRPGEPGVVLATAHPGKFPDAVASATGRRPPSPPGAAVQARGVAVRVPPEERALRDLLDSLG